MTFRQKAPEANQPTGPKARHMLVSTIALLSVLWLGACSPAMEPIRRTEPADSTSQQATPAGTQTASPSITARPTPAYGEGRSTRPPASLPPGLEPVPTQETTPVVGEVPSLLMDQILADLEKRLAVERQAIQVLRAEEVVWNDGSLGCPVPGQFYTQALVNGYWVVLRVDSRDYDYRASGKGYFFLCERRMP